MTRKKGSFVRALIVMLAVFAVLLSALVFTLDAMGRKSQTEQLAIVEDSIRSALMTCYAVEGGYPGTIDYLEEHYSLSYDHERIHVYYDAFASNIMPEVRVSMRGDEGR